MLERLGSLASACRRALKILMMETWKVRIDWQELSEQDRRQLGGDLNTAGKGRHPNTRAGLLAFVLAACSFPVKVSRSFGLVPRSAPMQSHPHRPSSHPHQ